MCRLAILQAVDLLVHPRVRRKTKLCREADVPQSVQISPEQMSTISGLLMDFKTETTVNYNLPPGAVQVTVHEEHNRCGRIDPSDRTAAESRIQQSGAEPEADSDGLLKMMVNSRHGAGPKASIQKGGAQVEFLLKNGKGMTFLFPVNPEEVTISRQRDWKRRRFSTMGSLIFRKAIGSRRYRSLLFHKSMMRLIAKEKRRIILNRKPR